MKLIAALIALFMLPGISGATGHNHQLCQGFVPENDMKIPVNRFWSEGQTGITEAEFNEVIAKFTALYEADFTARGAILKINSLWTNETVNASAEQSGNTWTINMYGGLARHETITRDAFALVICHEGGHHLGGAPKYKGWFGDDWASNEGQSDYFANLKCLRKFFVDEMKGYRVVRSEKNAAYVDACRAAHKKSIESRICIRSALAGMQVAKLFQALRKETVGPDFATPDKKVVTKIFDSHPATQCRLDTYFAGSLCTAKVDEAVSDTDFKTGTCAAEAGATSGVRPNCWFKAPAALPAGEEEVRSLWSGKTSPSEEAHKVRY